MSDLVLLTLMVPPQLEDALVDWMLSASDIQGFSSQAASGHSSRAEEMSLNEQVAGRTRRVRFEVQLPGEVLAETLMALQTDFRNSGIHYWAMPVLDAGAL
ncbi:DUF3240 family protein [Methylococcus geothermalis]|uniref:DUF3240 domain-containing protein n=1 Tax=Methylococcus geothermalis TaxID=2681310 RepID=A0A858QAQ3_9GAMM|nr:DUF3240 family protein [Methylococcus geothermalis]QJD30987.1 DUF3240 domain-containing protein [Methylococcus geothermalis]